MGSVKRSEMPELTFNNMNRYLKNHNSIWSRHLAWLANHIAKVNCNESKLWLLKGTPPSKRK